MVSRRLPGDVPGISGVIPKSGQGRPGTLEAGPAGHRVSWVRCAARRPRASIRFPGCVVRPVAPQVSRVRCAARCPPSLHRVPVSSGLSSLRLSLARAQLSTPPGRGTTQTPKIRYYPFHQRGNRPRQAQGDHSCNCRVLAPSEACRPRAAVQLHSGTRGPGPTPLHLSGSKASAGDRNPRGPQDSREQRPSFWLRNPDESGRWKPAESTFLSGHLASGQRATIPANHSCCKLGRCSPETGVTCPGAHGGSGHGALEPGPGSSPPCS